MNTMKKLWKIFAIVYGVIYLLAIAFVLFDITYSGKLQAWHIIVLVYCINSYVVNIISACYYNKPRHPALAVWGFLSMLMFSLPVGVFMEVYFFKARFAYRREVKKAKKEGTEIPKKTCPKCGWELRDGIEYCPGCGVKL